MHTFALIAVALCLLPIVMACGAGIPRPEHPRPDLQRANWLNLNGAWEFEIDPDGTGAERGLTGGTALSGSITVPFCPESSLSGVAHTDFMRDVWYRRSFEIPAAMAGKRILLNFGAVDWEAQVFVNGASVGTHRGGYTPFCFDITEHLREGANELVVHAHDETASGRQATGKQSQQRESHGCVYTRTTGIWQTVWLEAAGETYLREFSLVPDLDAGRALLQMTLGGPCAGRKVRVQALAGETVVAEELVAAAGRSTHAVLSIPNPRAWEPADPFLYGLRITVEQDGQAVDQVDSYFGLRKVHIEGNRILINNKPVFQRLVLDQGFYPDGIYTAPSDEALRRDIELSMAAGFNGARLHEKVFEPRLLYWADRLGYLVWGEYPNWGANIGDPDVMTQVVAEWHEVLRRDRNHPSVVGWCPLNETDAGIGAQRIQSILAVTRLVDPTRPYLDTSGYVHFDPDTDVYDSHNYEQSPEQFAKLFTLFSLTGQDAWNNNPQDPRSKYRGQPYFVSEYGGTKMVLGAQEQGGWGYGSVTTSVEEFLKRYKGLTDALLDNPNMFGFCYTQLTDIEQEQNGVYLYDRTPKYDPALLRAINARAAAYETMGPRVRKLNLKAIVPTSEQTAQQWRYAFTDPGEGWMAPDFDDTAWQVGSGGFGTRVTPGAVVGTEWKGSDVWIRREVDIALPAFEDAFLRVHHDEDAEVYVNGELVAEFSGYVQTYTLAPATEALRKALKPGRNVVAVHCRQTVGGQFIDVGIQVQGGE